VNLEDFLNLPTGEVVEIVRSKGPKVCVFPTDGTRRWHMLEHPESTSLESYMEVQRKRHLELYKLFFDHGIDTLLSPIFRPDLLDRGEAYMKEVMKPLTWLASHPSYLSFYKDYGVSFHVYGEYREYLRSTQHGHLLDTYARLTDLTRDRCSHRLFFGIFMGDPTETISKLILEFYSENGHPPDKKELIEMYYGEYVDPADMLIGFGRFCVHDAPLLLGHEGLYFTTSPSLYTDQQQLRMILYDYIYMQRNRTPDYGDLSQEDRVKMKDYYKSNMDKIIRISENRGVLLSDLSKGATLQDYHQVSDRSIY